MKIKEGPHIFPVPPPMEPLPPSSTTTPHPTWMFVCFGPEKGLAGFPPATGPPGWEPTNVPRPPRSPSSALT